MIIDVTLAWLVSNCGPKVSPNTSLAIISVESGGHPWAIDDDTTRKSYFPKTKDDAVQLASDLVAEGHTIDMGLMQVDSVHLATYGKTIADMFEPCTNVSVGTDILYNAYHAALRHYPPGKIALYHAFQIYNGAGANGNPHYADMVWSQGNAIAAGIR